jgi:anti-sigma regulatory factor (Ser/Thr protein kinase)
MNVIAPTRPTKLHGCRVRLTTGPTAAAEARSQVRTAICTWDIPVDPDIAVLLTSELVTNAVQHEPSETVTLSIRCCYGQLRVDVYDTARSMPAVVDAPAEAETGRGLMLVATLATKWGFYRTPAGKAVYFTLAFEPELDEGGEYGPRGSDVGTVSGEPPGDSPSPLRVSEIPVARSPRRDGAQG